MENKDKHIDQFFRDKMDAHLEPLSADDRMLFDKSIRGGKIGGGSVLRRIVKWLPYMSALSAAAAISYYGVVYRAAKMPEPVESTVVATAPKAQSSAPATQLPIVADTQMTTSVTQPFAVQQPQAIVPKLYSLPVAAPVMNSAQYRYEMLNSMLPLNKKVLTSTTKQYPASAVARQYDMPALPAISFTEPTENNNNSGGGNTTKRKRAQVGVYLGFESGFSKSAYNAGVLGVQVKAKVGNNMHLGIGAAARYGTTPDINLPQQLVTFDNYQRYVIVSQGKRGGQYTYNYREKVDSTVVKYSFAKQLFEVELPVFLQYDLNKHFSLSAGIRFIYGSVPQITATSTRYTPLYTDTLRDINLQLTAEEAVGLFDKKCNCNSATTADYQNPSYSTIRTGYMLGVQYRPIDNVELGLSLQQNSSSQMNIPNPDVRKMYALPYMRVSVGYTIGGKK